MNMLRVRRRGGFTLVELLVVIAIIAILAALITPAVLIALSRARDAKIKIELDGIASGMEAFKAKYGSYPPTNLTNPGSNPQLQAFMARAFPRYPLASLAGDIAFANGGTAPTTINPQSALVFWLMGQSPDPTNPFQGNGTRTPFFGFDPPRLVNASGVVVSPTPQTILQTVYNAPYGSAAYAYFDSQSYGTITPPNAAPNAITTTSNGVIAPYVADTNANGVIDATDTFAKPQSFQIISAGQDGNFGTNSTSGRLYPTGVGYDSSGYDDDNITNFNERGTLVDAKP